MKYSIETMDELQERIEYIKKDYCKWALKIRYQTRKPIDDIIEEVERGYKSSFFALAHYTIMTRYCETEKFAIKTAHEIMKTYEKAVGLEELRQQFKKEMGL